MTADCSTCWLEMFREMLEVGTVRSGKVEGRYTVVWTIDEREMVGRGPTLEDAFGDAIAEQERQRIE